MTSNNLPCIILVSILISKFQLHDAEECSKLKCSNTTKDGLTLRYFSGHVVDNTTIVGRQHTATFDGDESECIRECIDTDGCVTLLVADNNSTCWLYDDSRDIYEEKKWLQPKDGYKVINMGNGACRSQPCKNNGKCVPHYVHLNYTCECTKGFSGKKCDKPVEGLDSVMHFSFDDGLESTYTGTKLFAIPLSLFTQSCCKLVTTPERRGKVVYVGDETDGFDVTMASAGGYQGWMRNFFASKTDFTMSFWMKRIFTNVVVASEKILISVNLWRLTYNPLLGTVKWGIGVEHDPQGTNRFVLTCNVDDFSRWNYFAIAGSGVDTDQPGSLYMNGKLCEEKSLTKLKYKVNTKENAKYEHTKIKFFLKNVGHAMFDELKFFKSYPASSAVIKTMYESERKKLME